nr:hypothetical protein [Pontibacter amylolyticus]
MYGYEEHAYQRNTSKVNVIQPKVHVEPFGPMSCLVSGGGRFTMPFSLVATAQRSYDYTGYKQYNTYSYHQEKLIIRFSGNDESFFCHYPFDIMP